jgi:hypothetical protein
MTKYGAIYLTGWATFTVGSIAWYVNKDIILYRKIRDNKPYEGVHRDESGNYSFDGIVKGICLGGLGGMVWPFTCTHIAYEYYFNHLLKKNNKK